MGHIGTASLEWVRDLPLFQRNTAWGAPYPALGLAFLLPSAPSIWLRRRSAIDGAIPTCLVILSHSILKRLGLGAFLCRHTLYLSTAMCP